MSEVMENMVEGLTQAGEGDAMAAERKRAPAANFLPIVNGRIPLLFVHSIRFKETAGNNELAKKYATSVGKVFDIRKGRNFAYVEASWKPTDADVSAAQSWIEAIGKENSKHGIKVETGDVEALRQVVAEYVAAGLATEAEATAFAAARAATRPARKPKEAKPEGEATQDATADSLLD